MRHGESIWNKANQFTGWVDVPLNNNGILEAKAAGKRLRDAGYTFDTGYSSMLKRSIVTINHIID